MISFPTRTGPSRRALATALVSGAALIAPTVIAPVPASAVASVTVTVQMAEGTAAGSYATGFCAVPATTVALSMTCSDGSSQHVTFFTTSQTNTVVLAPGTYNTGVLGPPPTYALGGAGSVTIPDAATATCTFSMTAAPSCTSGSTPPPPPPTGIVVLHNTDPTASLATGWCKYGASFVLGSNACSDGTDQHVDLLAPGASATRRLEVTWWRFGVATLNPLVLIHDAQITGIGEDIVVECLLDATHVDCHYLDSNGDGIPDWQQDTVANVQSPSGEVVSVGSTDPAVTVSDVTAAPVPADAPTPPAAMPAGLLSFSVHLPVGATSADVTIDLPPGTGASQYFKLVDGAWVDFTSHASFSKDRVTLHLVDNDEFDSDPTTGVIGDPGAPALDTPTTTTVATCTGTRALATARSTTIAGDGLPAGLTTENDDAVVAGKGTYAPGTKDTPDLGSCTLSAPSDVVGPHTISRWSIKVDSRRVDCRRDADPAERQLSGQLSYTFGSGDRIDVRIKLAHFDPDRDGSNLVSVRGIATKGPVVGADLEGAFWWLPVTKDRAQASDWSGTVSPYDTAVYPGYRADLDALAGCLDASGATPADVRSLLLGDGASPVTGATAPGIALTFDL